MRETERQISIYKRQLPKMRERLFAALTILVVAAVMAVSSTFAWLVLSQNPEIKGMNTTVTANGNLEIALAEGETITEPAESEVGDSGKDLVVKNTTWGNLVNLGDPAYGLENVVLRPATLNKNSLLDQPLYGAGYGTDGRVESLTSDFAYAYWNVDTFSADKVKYGVRTVSSVTYGKEAGTESALTEYATKANDSITTAQNNFDKLAKNGALQDLVSLMGAYIDAQITEKLPGSSGEPIIEVKPEQVESIYYLLTELKTNMEQSADALAAVYNVQMLIRSDIQYVSANSFSGNYLLTATESEIKTKLSAKNPAGEKMVSPTMLSNLWTLKKDYNTVLADIEIIGSYRGRDDVVYRNLRGSTYPEIETYVNHIVTVSSTTVNGVPIGSLSMSNAGGLIGSGAKPIVINGGIFQRMDKFTGAQVKTNELTVNISLGSATGVATTSAKEPFVLPEEFKQALGSNTNYKGSNPIAGDTFGMALDFFLRTNASNAYLTLQGSPEYEERDETVSVTINGTKQTLYTATVDGEEITAYKNGDTFYEYNRQTETTGDALEITEADATVLTQKVKYVVGYSGVNRVWDETESAFLDDDSTTQGAGSCYVFYSSSPEDQEKALQLLSHFSIAFIDENGTLLGEAYLDTKNKIEQSGKVTVPLVLSVTNDSITSANGDTVYTITQLEPNEATFITALVYLDGATLTNDQVLAAGEIQGQLNIQFGTTADLNAMDDPALMESKCYVTATMEGDTTVSSEATEAELNKTVTVSVDGYEPSRVEAYFSREINSTQGIRQGKITFTQNESGDWVGSYQFTSPGKYVLREVLLDGVTYELDQDPITFTVEGFAISSVLCSDDGKTYMTTDKSFDTSVSLTFATDDPAKMPGSVKGAFIHEETGNRTTVYFTKGAGSTWTGDATFTTSGTYVLDYVELDNEYTGLDEKDHITIDLMLGLTASVYTGERTIALEDGNPIDVNMSLVIKNDAGEVISGLTNVWMQFANNGSIVDGNAIGADMVWNASRDMYEGTFHITKPGIYTYHCVDITLQGDNHNYLYSAVVSPTINAISTTPVRYLSKSGFGPEEVFSLNNDVAFTITMNNASAATVDAVLKNEAGETYYVRGKMTDRGSEQDFKFIIPIIDGSQSGTWTLDGIYLSNVTSGSAGTQYIGAIENGPDTGTETEGKPPYNYTVADNYYADWLHWSIDDITNESDTVDPVIKVVSDINVSFSSNAVNANKVFGKTGDTVTATFGTVHTLGELELLITAGSESKSLADYGLSVTGVELTYNYDPASVSQSTVVTNPYGGYSVSTNDWKTISSESNTKYVYNTVVANSTDSTLYTITPKNTDISVAGRYKATSMTLTFKDANGATATKTISANIVNTAPTFEVYSAKPIAKITGITPTGSNPTKITYTTSGIPWYEGGGTRPNFTATGNMTSQKPTDYTATVYAVASADNGSAQHHGQFTQPSVTIELSGMGEASSASLTLPGNSTVSAVTYTYDTDKKVTNKLGTIKQIKSWTSHIICTHTLQAYYGHGTKTISQVVMTKDSVDYTFNLDNPLTITNPSSVNQ